MADASGSLPPPSGSSSSKKKSSKKNKKNSQKTTTTRSEIPVLKGVDGNTARLNDPASASAAGQASGNSADKKEQKKLHTKTSVCGSSSSWVAHTTCSYKTEANDCEDT